MALIGLEFRSRAPPISQQQQQHPLDIDLNRHAFDLNEVPLVSDLNMGFPDDDDDVSAPATMTPSSLRPTARRGDWLELFRNMSGHESLVGTLPFISAQVAGPRPIPHSNGSCGGGEHNFHPNLHNGKRPRPHSRPRKQPGYDFFELPICTSNSSLHTPIIPEQVHSSTTLEQPLFHNSEQDKVPNTLRRLEFLCFSQLQAPRSTSSGKIFQPSLFEQGNLIKAAALLEQGQTIKKARAYCAELDKNKSGLEQAFFAPLSHLPTTRADRTKALNGVPEQDLCNIKCQQTLPRSLMQENRLRINEQPSHQNAISSQSSSGLDRSTFHDPQPSLAKVKDSASKIIASPDWLPTGWITEVRTRKAGSTAGITDKYYKDPVTGRRFRSKNEVMRYLQTGCVSRYKPKDKHLESTAPNTNTSQILPVQEQMSSILCPLNPVDLKSYQLHSFPGLGTSFKRVVKSNFLSKFPGCLGEEKVWVKQEGEVGVKQEDEVVSRGPSVCCATSKVSDICTPVEELFEVTKGRPDFGIKLESGKDSCILGHD